MNAADVTRFDRLHFQKDRTPLEEEEYQVLLERVVLGKDGKSEFPTGRTEMEMAMLRKDACDFYVQQTIDKLLKLTPQIAEAVARGLLAGLGK